jgi:hypothetical protein
MEIKLLNAKLLPKQGFTVSRTAGGVVYLRTFQKGKRTTQVSISDNGTLSLRDESGASVKLSVAALRKMFGKLIAEGVLEVCDD